MSKKACPVCGEDMVAVPLSAAVVRFECRSCGYTKVVDNRGRKMLTEIEPTDGQPLKG